MKQFMLLTVLYILCQYGVVMNVSYIFALANKLPTMKVHFASLGMSTEQNWCHNIYLALDCADDLP
jgi:hypothetical protein